METISRAAAERSKRGVDEDKLKADAKKLSDQVKSDSRAYKTSAHLLDDGVIDPRDTRDVLGMCLEVVSLQPIHGNPGFRGLARI